VILYKNKAKYKIVRKNQEEDFDKIINLFKNPLRFLQFFGQTRSTRQLKISIGCKNKRPIFQLNKFSTNEVETANSRRNYKSECLLTKICPNNLYTLYMERFVNLNNLAVLDPCFLIEAKP